MSSTREQLILEIETYLARTGMSQTEFGLEVMSDGSFVTNLRKGADPKASTIDRVRNWIANHPLARRTRKAEARSAA